MNCIFLTHGGAEDGFLGTMWTSEHGPAEASQVSNLLNLSQTLTEDSKYCCKPMRFVLITNITDNLSGLSLIGQVFTTPCMAMVSVEHLHGLGYFKFLSDRDCGDLFLLFCFEACISLVLVFVVCFFKLLLEI